MAGYTKDKKAVQQRLKRIEGQVRGLQRMVEEDTYCIDVMTQVSSVNRALQSARRPAGTLRPEPDRKSSPRRRDPLKDHPAPPV